MIDRSVTAEGSAGRALRPTQALFRRLLLINGLLFSAATLVLAFSPATVSAPVQITEIPVLVIGLLLILAANAVLVRGSLAPLDALATLMQRVDLLRASDRLTERDHGDVTHLVHTFNTMLDRLEAERSESSAHALAAQEAERQRIARELHDEIGQSLTVVLLGLKRTVDRAPAELREELHAMQETVRDSLDEVRQVARRLRPGVLADLGLQSALHALSSEFGELRVNRWVDHDLPELSPDVELVLYRIAQESLTNVARHAGAAEVDLSLTVRRGQLTLRVTDNGTGGIEHEGAGIRGMRERALLIGAKLTVTSTVDGTDVCLRVPR
ncbi:HAMP domain-containing sensor histidine kinase [Amycolatopsis magusensis]|uniref:histidine kinase n=1 Tax=Amycolatopsis magusensis TaxID=882444 RepID=A0ABS4Q141_9PSEU|nr:histidine kinase [Amycolatopsis magusensis]MBP2185387.1 two-component system sensor histidine kinase UhpB [Amycolatopsis magusensis]